MGPHRFLSVCVCAVVLLLSCGDQSPSSSPPYTSRGHEALVIVIENKDMVGSEMELAFAFYGEEITNIFADVFGINKADMHDMELSEIVDVYGEAWQIEEIRTAAQSYYSRIVMLTDGAASGQAVLDTMAALTGDGFVIDMVWNLHGSWSSVLFSDRSYSITELTDAVTQDSLALRALYQTCCYGGDMVDEWEDAGITAVNGARDENAFAIFSPQFFVREWTRGKTFGEAVQSAFQLEQAEIRKYNSYVPDIEIEDYLLTQTIIENSTQTTGGTDDGLMWQDYNAFSVPTE